MARFALGDAIVFAPFSSFPLGSPPMTICPASVRARTARVVLLALAIVATAGCYQDPQQAMDQQQLLTDLGDALNQLTLQTSELTAQVDSLSAIVAKQDTAIYRMANVTGVPYVR